MHRPPRVFVKAYGCQMNKLDAELTLSALLREGYVHAESPDEADVILFHTCSVRAHAEERVYSNVGKLKHLKRKRPNLVIGIVGCMAQRERERIFERLPHVDLVCGTSEFPRIADLVAEARRSRRVVACGDAAVSVTRDVSHRPEKFRAYVSIMRGCDNFCTYCIVPYLRGREVSRHPDEIVEEVGKLVDDGCIEITLLGQNVNSYGKSFGRPGALPDLLERLDAIPGLARLRFVTSHPKDMTQKIFEAVRDLRSVCEHLHMPAQSGSDRILAAMNRRYTSGRYRELVAMAREMVPEIAIAGDFIVGFPGETEEDFQETVSLVRDVRFQQCFVFKYSPRPGTAAARLPDDVPFEEKRRRNTALLDIQAQVSEAEHKKFIGRTVEVLVEGRSRRDPHRLTGRTRTNHIVVFEGPDSLTGRLVEVKITSSTALTLSGEITPAPARAAGSRSSR